MTSKKIKKLLIDKGPSGLIQAVIFKILTNCFHIPSRKIAMFNGIAVRGASLYSKIEIYPEHEAELISAIRNYIKSDENVLVIGGGTGASTVAVAHQVGIKGTVITYEGNKNSVNVVNDTINLNKVEDRVSVKHMIVEKPVHLMGFVGEASTILAKDFPECDVLVMDCEGAELPILQNLIIKPRLIIVETHPMFDSPEEKIIELLKNLGYDIISNDLRQESLEILSAVRKN
jgi:precorrin-6B methylase 2